MFPSTSNKHPCVYIVYRVRVEILMTIVMQSVGWICPPCTPPPPQEPRSLVYFCSLESPGSEKKMLTETNIGLNFMLTPFFHRYPPDDILRISRT